MKYKTIATIGVMEKMNNEPIFNRFVVKSLDRFFSGDYGEVKEPEENTGTDKLAVYSFYEDCKIWIKQDYNIITVLFPSEY